jgi:ribonucleoside-diphosphate reductase subunit M2
MPCERLPPCFTLEGPTRLSDRLSPFMPNAPRLLNHRLTDERVVEIITAAVEIEREFICEALPCDLIGMNARMMSDYINFVADRLLVALGLSKHYKTPNPFEWMEQLSLQ